MAPVTTRTVSCDQCGNDFQAVHPSARYCSNTCRQKHFQGRKLADVKREAWEDTKLIVDHKSVPGKVRIIVDMGPESYALYQLWAENRGSTVDAILKDFTTQIYVKAKRMAAQMLKL